MAYATISDVKAKYTTAASDNAIQAALDFATALVNAQTLQTWGPVQEERVFDDIRTAVVPIPDEFHNVTQVRVGNTVLDQRLYYVLPWGVRFAGGPISLTPVQVAVTATYGKAVTPLVKEATLLLTIDRLGAVANSGEQSGGTSLIPSLPGNVTSFSVEGLSVSMNATTGISAISTGNTDVDRLLSLAAPRKVGIV